MKEIKPIKTIIECPECKKKIDFSGLKKEIKQRLDQELDYILDKL